MISAIAYLVAAYAVARLIQVPVEAWQPETPGQQRSKLIVLVLVTIVGVFAVVVCVGMVHQAGERIADSATRLR